MKTIIEDTRPIKSIRAMVGIYRRTVGVSMVTKIVAYNEPGQSAYVPYLAVYLGDEIWERVPANAVVIQYGIDKEIPF